MPQHRHLPLTTPPLLKTGNTTATMAGWHNEMHHQWPNPLRMTMATEWREQGQATLIQMPQHQWQTGPGQQEQWHQCKPQQHWQQAWQEWHPQPQGRWNCNNSHSGPRGPWEPWGQPLPRMGQWGQQLEDEMMPGPGDNRQEDDDTEEDQHQGNRDSGDNKDNNGRDNRNDGCKDWPGMKGMTGTRSKQWGTQTTRPWQQRQQGQQEQHTAHPQATVHGPKWQLELFGPR